ncbi:MAG: hypothetical protein HY690_01015 [Chloroflexi bacterium]|nr:hypothetical protein [Chloroflexota bacterium]
MSVQPLVTIGRTTIEVLAGELLDQPVEAILLSANNGLKANQTKWSWSREVEQRAGAAYTAECRDVVAAAGTNGLAQGSAVVTGAGCLAHHRELRWILQAITIGYRPGQRAPATPAIVYGAVRAALERAETFRVASVATYLMAIRPGYGAPSPEALAGALMRALLDHAAVATSVQRVVVCESNQSRLDLALSALEQGAEERRCGRLAETDA